MAPPFLFKMTGGGPTCGQLRHGVVDGVRWFLGAGVELLHLHRLNFAAVLQVEDLDVAGEKRFHAGGPVVGDLHQALGRRKESRSKSGPGEVGVDTWR